MSIILLLIIHQDIDFEDLYNKATTSLVQFQAVKDSAVEEFIRLGKDSLFSDIITDFLVSKFDTKSAMEQHTLKNILKELGDRSIEGIVKKINYRGSDETARCLAQSLWILGEIGSEAIIEPTASFIHDEKWQIRSAAYTALGKVKTPLVLPYALQGLDDSISVVRKSAYYALAQIATPNEISYLIAGLGDQFYGVRYTAYEGLLRIGDQAWLPLVQALGDGSLTNYFILKALVQLDPNDKAKKDLLKFLDKSAVPIRLLIYEGIQDRKSLRFFLKSEQDALLRNYLNKKISALD